MKRLTASDSWYLYLETPTVHMQVCGVVVVDPAAAREPLTVEAVRRHVAQRVQQVPRFRRRLVEVPLGIDHPVWADDPDLRVEDHVRHHVVRRPRARALDDVVGRFCSEPLDRSRPLWEMLWVEGLPEGRAALATRLHHSMVDGVTGVGLIAHLLDISPEPAPGRRRSRSPAPPAPLPGPVVTVRDALVDRLTDPLRPVRAAARTGRSTLGLARAAVGTAGRATGAASPVGAPRAPFNGSLTARRAVATGRAPLDEVTAVARACGATTNEVVLAATTTGLRRLLQRDGGPTDRPLVCSVPASMRRRRAAGDGHAPGPQPANLLVPLPVHVEDPMERLREVHRGVAAAGRVQGAVGNGTLGDVAELVPPLALSWGASWWSRLRLADRVPPAHNLIVSSVPGSPVPLYLAGAPVTAMFPFGPLAEGVGLNVTLVAHQDTLDIGVMSCPDLVGDVGAVVSGMLDGLGLLAELAGNGQQVDLRGGRRQGNRAGRGAASTHPGQDRAGSPATWRTNSPKTHRR